MLQFQLSTQHFTDRRYITQDDKPVNRSRSSTVRSELSLRSTRRKYWRHRASRVDWDTADPAAKHRHRNYTHLAPVTISLTLVRFTLHTRYRHDTNWIKPVMPILKPKSNRPLIPQYSDRYTGHWWVAVTYGAARISLGGLGPRPVPFSLYQM